MRLSSCHEEQPNLSQYLTNPRNIVIWHKVSLLCIVSQEARTPSGGCKNPPVSSIFPFRGAGNETQLGGQREDPLEHERLILRDPDTDATGEIYLENLPDMASISTVGVLLGSVHLPLLQPLVNRDRLHWVSWYQ